MNVREGAAESRWEQSHRGLEQHVNMSCTHPKGKSDLRQDFRILNNSVEQKLLKQETGNWGIC